MKKTPETLREKLVRKYAVTRPTPTVKKETKYATICIRIPVVVDRDSTETELVDAEKHMDDALGNTIDSAASLVVGNHLRLSRNEHISWGWE